MGTDDSAPGGREPDRQAVFVELAGELRAHVGRTHGRDAAAAVFRHATGGRVLVGLVTDPVRAVFYDADARALTVVPVDRHGLDHPDARALWTRLSDPATWVDARAGELAWVHPRYRWVLETDRSTWRFRR